MVLVPVHPVPTGFGFTFTNILFHQTICDEETRLNLSHERLNPALKEPFAQCSTFITRVRDKLGLRWDVRADHMSCCWGAKAQTQRVYLLPGCQSICVIPHFLTQSGENSCFQEISHVTFLNLTLSAASPSPRDQNALWERLLWLWPHILLFLVCTVLHVKLVVESQHWIESHNQIQCHPPRSTLFSWSRVWQVTHTWGALTRGTRCNTPHYFATSVHVSSFKRRNLVTSGSTHPPRTTVCAALQVITRWASLQLLINLNCQWSHHSCGPEHTLIHIFVCWFSQNSVEIHSIVAWTPNRRHVWLICEMKRGIFRVTTVDETDSSWKVDIFNGS